MPEKTTKTWSQHLRERSHVLIVIRDAVVALIVFVGLSAVAWALALVLGFVSLFAGGASFQTLAVLPVYGIPALIVGYGVIKARLGVVLVPVLIAAVSYFVADDLHRQDRAALDKFPVSGLAPPSQAHDVLAFEGIGENCDAPCRYILATSDITLAWKTSAWDNWGLRKRAADCRDEAQALSVLEFLHNGYRGVCATRTTAKSIGDALVWRWRQVPSDRPELALPERVSGSIYEISERIAGNERLLGRQLVGHLAPPFPFVIGAFGRLPEAINLGPKINSGKEFLALGTGIASEVFYAAPTPLPFAERLDEAERFFGSSSEKVANKAAGVWIAIAAGQGHAHQEELRARVERMLALDDDLRRLGAALNALTALRPANRAFAQDRLIELAFSPLLPTKYAALVATLKTQLNSPAEPFAVAVRARAKTLFIGDAALAPQQRQIFFMLMVRGGEATRREAVDTLFSLEGLPFEESVRAIGDGQSADVWASTQPAQWSREEIDRLVARAARVPNERLNRYLSGFRFGHFVSKEQKAGLVEQVRERLRVAEAAPRPDENVIKELKRLIEAIPGNISS
ncbi:MAG: hypothetical protein ABWY92_22205 [Xanthobacteraceae bacterium]